MDTYHKISEVNYIETIKTFLDSLNKSLRSLEPIKVEKKIYNKSKPEEILVVDDLNKTKNEFCSTDQVCLKSKEKTPQQPDQTKTIDTTTNNATRLQSRNPFSYTRMYSSSFNESLNILVWFLMAFLLIIGASLILNCLSTYIDKSPINILYMKLISRKENYLPLLFTAFSIMIFVGVSACLKLILKPKYIVNVYIAFMILFAIMTLISSVLIIQKRFILETSVDEKLSLFIKIYPKDSVVIDSLQAKFDCCGNKRYTDWFTSSWANNTNSIPSSCYENEQKFYQRGCKAEIISYFRRYFGDYLIGCFGIGCAILLVIITCFVIVFVKKMRQFHQNSNDENIVIELTSNHKIIA